MLTLSKLINSKLFFLFVNRNFSFFLGATASQPRLQDRQNEANIQYTYRQEAILWSAFSQTTHPKPDEREFLAQQMGLPAEKGARLVQIWFQNRRNNLISSTTQSSGTYFIF